MHGLHAAGLQQHAAHMCRRRRAAPTPRRGRWRVGQYLPDVLVAAPGVVGVVADVPRSHMGHLHSAGVHMRPSRVKNVAARIISVPMHAGHTLPVSIPLVSHMCAW